MNPLKIGVIGCGGRGTNTWRAHQPENGIEMIAGSDVNPEYREAFQKKFPHASVFADYRMLLALREVDCVMISTPLAFHEAMASDAMRAGKAVFLEKPMADTLDGCDRLLRLSRATGCKLYVGHNLRGFSFLSSLKKQIDGGVIGEVKAVWCRHFVGKGNHSDDFFHRSSIPRYSHGLLLHKGSHDIDAIHWLGGAYASKVTGMGCGSVFEKQEMQEDHNMILFELANGVQATYLQCHFAPDDFRNYTVIGTLGRIENTGDNYGVSTIHIWSNRGGFTEYWTEQTPPCIKNGVEDADDTMVNNFLAWLRCDAAPLVTALDARYAVGAALAGKHSMRSGRTECVSGVCSEA